MADTIGDLVDKLTIANIKLWHIEDDCRALREAKQDDKAAELLVKVNSTNKERNRLIDQINASLKIINENKGSLSLSVEDLLGTGKNKYYKGD